MAARFLDSIASLCFVNLLERMKMATYHFSIEEGALTQTRLYKTLVFTLQFCLSKYVSCYKLLVDVVLIGSCTTFDTQNPFKSIP